MPPPGTPKQAQGPRAGGGRAVLGRRRQQAALLAEGGDLELVNPRRGNCRVQLASWVRYICKRERVETVFSQVASALGRTVHAVTPRVFELKVFLTVVAYSILA